MIMPDIPYNIWKPLSVAEVVELLRSEAKQWLKDQLCLLYPNGHAWLAHLG
jgi:hypothetical protein